MSNRFVTYHGHTVSRAIIIALTLMSFVIAITVDTWHTHDAPVFTEWKKHHPESQNQNSASHSDENCPLCYHHLTKDILVENIVLVIKEEDSSDYPFFLISADYTESDHGISVRGPPFFHNS